MRTTMLQGADRNGGSVRRSARRLALLLSACLVLPDAGCRDPLNVHSPDIVTPANLNDPRALPAIRAGAIGDFTLAYSGSGAQGSGGTTEGIIMTTGLLGDEWINSETFPTRIEVDARRIQVNNATMQTVFRDLSRARRAAEFAADKYRALADTTASSGFPEMLALAGLTYVFFAENYCSGVPFSRASESGTFTFGPALTTTQILDTAISRFNAALAAASALDITKGVSAGTKALITNLATVGKARAQLDEDSLATAAATVAAVPTTFVYFAEHSEITTRENNGVFNGNTIFKRYSVADKEGGNGLPFRSVADPRTPSRRLPAANRGFDGATPQFDNLRFGTRSAPVPIATGLEARLIEAEAALQAGDFATFLSKHNALRQTPPPYIGTDTVGPAIQTVAPLVNLGAADTVAAGSAVNLHFAERARWLWLSAHRLSDLRRLVRQYGRLADAVFPTGPYFKAQFSAYGTDVNFPIPFDEFNNPNLSDLPPTQSCIDRNP